MNKDRIKTFAEQVYRDMAGTMTVGMAYIGVETGLFRTMAGKGPMLPEDVAAGSELQPRYVEEWLKGVTTAGYLEHDPEAGTFTLPEEHAQRLASEGTDHFMGGLFYFAPVALRIAPRVAEAFRNGGGVKFEDFGPDCVSALDLIAACDCIHDFAAPERTLAEIRALLRPGGTLFVLEPRAGDRLEDNIHPLGTVYYGFSLFHCMTQSLAEGGPGLGTCMGPAQTMDLLRRSGLNQVEPLDIKSQTHLFYAARA